METFRFEEPLDVVKGEINVNIETGSVVIEPHDLPAVWVEGEGRRVDVSVSRHEDVVYVTSEDQETGWGKWLAHLAVLSLDEEPDAQIHAKSVTGRITCDFDLANQKRGGSLTGDHLSGVIGAGTSSLWAKVVTGTVHLKRCLPDVEAVKLDKEALAAV